LVNNNNDFEAKRRVADEIARACRECGFFYVTNHGVDAELERRLELATEKFFSLPREKKLEISVDPDEAIRFQGYISNVTDNQDDDELLKIVKISNRYETARFTRAFGPQHERIKNEMRTIYNPLVYPDTNVAELRELIDTFTQQMNHVLNILLEAIAISLELPETFFYEKYTKEPYISLCLINYPKVDEKCDEKEWGVSEHSDLTLLTVLKQDETGGLQIKSTSGWIDAKPVPNSLVCNIGDLLDYMTGGEYLSTVHRVVRPTTRNRTSWVTFFGPNLCIPIEKLREVKKKVERWDKKDLHAFSGSYGDYIASRFLNYNDNSK